MFDLICAVMCGQPIVLSEQGRLRSQRPRPAAPLAGWIRLTVRLLVVQILWAGIFFVISFTRRGGAGVVGLLLNPVYIGTGILGLVGSLWISWPLLAISLITSGSVLCAFVAFVLLNFFTSVEAGDPGAWVVLALFLPGLCVDLLILLGCSPLLLALIRAERMEAPGQVDVEVAAGGADSIDVAAHGFPGAAEPSEVPALAAASPRACVVCMEAAPDTVLLNCRHMLCAACVTKLKKANGCPICRSKIRSTMKVFV